ncbi:hypothetical protein BTA51_08730 [Hahella sp. CCB-MM4]|uniref:hypothetical protein n=1 Tax=Hahella sp. (strain CCB-MM4) TaxID=1926491 RepID=UPI000B9B5877|nr:hypothetical protein [Hahella sp. CCB-MM4]OZG73864.1 hypothetical protein BTA51_08730 [Hahella sp. CCB-MM4]
MKQTLAVILALFLVGCGGSEDSGGSNGTKTGYLTFDGIAGLPYRTASQSGVTDELGRFHYLEGETISFYLGDIVFAQDIPTKPYLTVIDFDQDVVDQIDEGSQVRGMTDHTELVEAASKEQNIVNMTRLLFAITDPPEDKDSDDIALIYISGDVRAAAKAYSFSSPIIFDQDVGNFGSEDLPDNQENLFINYICEKLGQAACLNGGVKEMPASEQAETFGKSQSEDITSTIASKIFLSPRVFEINATDTRVYDVSITAVNLDLNIAELEVKTIDELPDSEGNFPDDPRSVVAIQYGSASNARFGFYATGESGQETSIIANIKLKGDYRWYKKSLRVRLR